MSEIRIETGRLVLRRMREAFFRETVFFDGEWHDQYGLAILREEWAGRGA